jgi:hypothetical protein
MIFFIEKRHWHPLVLSSTKNRNGISPPPLFLLQYWKESRCSPPRKRDPAVQFSLKWRSHLTPHDIPGNALWALPPLGPCYAFIDIFQLLPHSTTELLVLTGSAMSGATDPMTPRLPKTSQLCMRRSFYVFEAVAFLGVTQPRNPNPLLCAPTVSL